MGRSSNLPFAIALCLIFLESGAALQITDDTETAEPTVAPNIIGEQQDSLLSQEFDTLDTTLVDTTTADSNHSELVCDLVKPLILTGLLGGLLLLLFTQRGGR